MDSNISINDKKLIFENVNKSIYINYRFIDDIGEFSKKYSLKFSEWENTIQLNLVDSFGKNVDSNIKIEFNIVIKKFIDIELMDINPLFIVRIYTINQKLFLELKEKSDLISHSINNGKIYFCSANNTEILLRKMISIDSKFYFDEQKINNKENIISINEIFQVIKKEAIKNQVWKLYIKLYDKYNNSIYNEVELKELYEYNENRFSQEGITYNITTNSIIYNNLINEKEMVVTNITDFKENLIITFNKLKEKLNLYTCVRNRQSNPFDFQIINVFKPNRNIVVIPKNELSKYWMKNGDNIELLIGENLNSAKFIEFEIDTKQKYNYFYLSNDLSCKFYKNGRNAISIYIKEMVKNVGENAIKIAVLGTCFSRNSFNSMDFFNPNYKKNFNCVYTQFHSSIGSLISKAAPKECVELYNDSNDLQYIKTDMEKTFFDDLSLAKPDFLIIDLYADAMLQELQLTNDSIITYNYMIKEKHQLGDYVINWGTKYHNGAKFFSAWKENVNIFMRKLNTIIPIENIILNRGRLSEYYYNESGELIEFKTKDLIKRNNYYWERLDNIFLNEFPSISCIDLTDEGFYSVLDYPFGFSYSHYESSYYETFLNELMKIILDKK
ncbi:hypothetical protein JGY91_12865 [Staphylococcus xylosus]|uniref:DUF6270 domain-containing protein n=1 Tax=Staphylococcus xylosus TaxID=1288 RepID=UPI000853A057|nr:DUF6270 domain-containing protein [Staphylococcus xylosus]MCA2501193.1 hypothetical protein [Staphylococcus xylosus]MCA2501404.1 hypothetical protein [Staphylococcus xylosus]MCE7780979.1 DUF6270 domain-containing protein [Staphylococcus xylosus]OEK87046.1 hypothetical protein AST17_04800 [Staphylococcus xylosus]